MSQPAADFDPFAGAPEPESKPVDPLASLIRCYFGPKPSFYYQEEEDAYYQSLDELHEEITERLAGREGRIMDAAPRLLDACREAEAVLREVYELDCIGGGTARVRLVKAGARLQDLLGELS